MDLLTVAWIQGSVPGKPDELRRVVCMEKAEWRKVWPELDAKWPLGEDGQRRNPKLEVVRAELDAYAESKRTAGQKGGWAKASKPAPPTNDDGGKRLPKAKQEPSTKLANIKQEPSRELAESYPASASASASATPSSDDDTGSASSSPTAGQLRLAAVELLGLWAHARHRSASADLRQAQFQGKTRIVGRA